VIHKTLVETDSGPVVRVAFTLPNSIWADQICLVGDFNGWSHTSHPMQRDRQGDWQIVIDLELGRAYQFRYLCDGERWMNDSQADAYVLSPYGSDNFVIITDPHFKQQYNHAGDA
jgi:1,4-alpha-glucan branching enzyme